MRRIFPVSLLAIAMVMGFGCGKGTDGPPQQGVPEVAVIAIETERALITSELPGRTSPRRIAEIRPQVSGIIQQRLFEEGGEVEAGEVLYKIDSAPFQAALNSAEATLAQVRANLSSLKLRVERYASLLDDKAISQQEYDDALAAMQQAEAGIAVGEAAVKLAWINLKYTEVTAPISGRIGRSSMTDGALVTAYQPLALATIQQLDPIYVDVPQAAIERLQLERRLASGHLGSAADEHLKVALKLADGSIYPLKGKLQFQDVTVDPTTGSVILRVLFPNPDGILLPGMFVRAEIVEGVDEDAILLPQQCVSRNAKGDPHVLAVNSDGIVELRPITIDRSLDGRWVVSDGLQPGDLVIIEGMQKVRPGAPAKTSPYKAESKGDMPPKKAVDQSQPAK